MTDFIEGLLTSMSSKFNETNTDLTPINLNEDKTLKWRGLHNNQYAAVKKRKDGKRNEKSTITTTTTTSSAASTMSTDDPPPLLNASSVAVNADDVATTADVTKINEKSDSVLESCTIKIEKTQATTAEAIDSVSGIVVDMKSEKTDKMTERTNNNDKERINDTKDDDQRPFRRTLRRKQNVDESNDDSNASNSNLNRKIGLRSKSSASGGSVNENRSVSPKREKDEKSTGDTLTGISGRTSVMTRTRGRARKLDSEHSGSVDEINEIQQPKEHNERNISLTNEVDDGSANNNQPTPPKLRRSIRSLQSSHSSDHASEDRTTVTESKPTELTTRSRKRTVDDKKTQEPSADEIKEEKTSTDDKTVPSVIEIDISHENETGPIIEVADVKKTDDVEMVEVAPAETTIEEQVVPAKRGRRPAPKAKGNLKLNTTITTRNSPVKKSPKVSSDESPFIYSIPKKDKSMDQPVSFYLIYFYFLFFARN